MPQAHQLLHSLVTAQQSQLIELWSERLRSEEKGDAGQLRTEMTDLLRALGSRLEAADEATITSRQKALDEVLTDASQLRAVRGQSPESSVRFVQALKDAMLFMVMPALPQGQEDRRQASELLQLVMDRCVTTLVTQFVAARERVIRDQALSLLDMSTPVITLWDSILLLPLVGVVDSVRSVQIAERLLEAIGRTEAAVTIIDVTRRAGHGHQRGAAPAAHCGRRRNAGHEGDHHRHQPRHGADHRQAGHRHEQGAHARHPQGRCGAGVAAHRAPGGLGQRCERGLTMRVPLLKLNARTLIVPLYADVSDETVLSFQADLTQRVSEQQITGVVLDVSALDVVDSYMARVLNETASMLRLLGASVVVCGVQPAVALTLVEMGRDLVDVPTAFNLERALQRLGALQEQADAEHHTEDARRDAKHHD